MTSAIDQYDAWLTQALAGNRIDETDAKFEAANFRDWVKQLESADISTLEERARFIKGAMLSNGRPKSAYYQSRTHYATAVQNAILNHPDTPF